MPEIKHHCADAPVLLVGEGKTWRGHFNTAIPLSGTKMDLREDKETLQTLSECGQSPVRREQGQKLANKIRAIKYLECSALTQRGLKQVIEHVLKGVPRCEWPSIAGIWRGSEGRFAPPAYSQAAAKVQSHLNMASNTYGRRGQEEMSHSYFYRATFSNLMKTLLYLHEIGKLLINLSRKENGKSPKYNNT